MSRIVRFVALFTTALTGVVWPATAALASTPPPDPAGSASSAEPLTTIVTHSSSGLGLMAVLLIAAASIVVGALLPELVRAVRRHGRYHGLATA